ncbi:MAG: VOC family protein [Actinobacteria bacterium]|nr:VOC family protein [Actinomycetota bacterium]
MTLDLYAGICVSDYAAARPRYERLLGAEPSFLAHETEAVWELAEHRWISVVEDAARAGNAVHTIFVEDLDSLVSEIASRRIEPAERETYTNGVRKTIYRDADGNEIGFGGAPG